MNSIAKEMRDSNLIFFRSWSIYFSSYGMGHSEWAILGSTCICSIDMLHIAIATVLGQTFIFYMVT